MQLFKNASASSAVRIFFAFCLKCNRSFPEASLASNQASILNVLMGVNALISLSLSAISLTATLCTRPALRLFRILILRQSTGDSSNPTIRSSIRLACCAFTRFISTVRGDFTAAFRMAGLVISWKTILLVVLGSSPSTSHKCQLMASPSRSSSVASHTSPDFFARLLTPSPLFAFLRVQYSGA